MPAGVPHQEVGSDPLFSAWVIVHDVTRVILLGLRCDVGGSPQALPIRTRLVNDGHWLADLLSETARALNRNSPTGPHLFRAYLGRMQEIFETKRPESERQYSLLVSRCMDLLFTEMGAADLSISNIARRLNCNADSLSARFSREVGQTTIEYLTHLRMEQACKLLRESPLTIAEIAWTSGYSDPNYFSRVFKKTIGVTPRNFRKEP